VTDTVPTIETPLAVLLGQKTESLPFCLSLRAYTIDQANKHLFGTITPTHQQNTAHYGQISQVSDTLYKNIINNGDCPLKETCRLYAKARKGNYQMTLF